MNDKKDTRELTQLALNLCLPDTATWENFYVGDNAELVLQLQQLDQNPSAAQLTYLWGAAGSGRSHLLAACCWQFHEQNLKAAYLPLTELKSSSPKVLENLEHLELLCLDDLDAVIGKRHWEEAIMHCFNQLQHQQHRLIVSANATPHALAFALPDLQSRMASGMICKVNELNDQQKIEALQLRAKTLGLALTTKTAQFLLRHCKRDTHTLFSTLRQLDRAALQAKSKLTTAFIKRVLGL